MKPLFLILVFLSLSYISHSQALTKTGHYQGLRYEYAKEEVAAPDTVYKTDTVYVEIPVEKVKRRRNVSWNINFGYSYWNPWHSFYSPWDYHYMNYYSYYDPWYYGYGFRYHHRYYSYWNYPYHYSHYHNYYTSYKYKNLGHKKSYNTKYTARRGGRANGVVHKPTRKRSEQRAIDNSKSRYKKARYNYAQDDMYVPKRNYNKPKSNTYNSSRKVQNTYKREVQQNELKRQIQKNYYNQKSYKQPSSSKSIRNYSRSGNTPQRSKVYNGNSRSRNYSKSKAPTRNYSKSSVPSRKYTAPSRSNSSPIFRGSGSSRPASRSSSSSGRSGSSRGRQ